jgi:hypothetical protein
MATFVHRPTRVDAVRWTGENLPDVEQFAGQPRDGVELAVDRISGALWVTQHFGRTEVFPVARGHMLVRLPSERLIGMQRERFDALYDAAPELVPA